MIHQTIPKTGSGQRTDQPKTSASPARLSDHPMQRRSDGAPQAGHNFAYVAVHRPDRRPAAHGQPQTPSNQTGLPDTLKAGVEQLAGISLDDVKVHYNSAKPAQLDALAFTQGRDIHVAPGQEQHLPHEAWHVVQQASGRVQPTMQMTQGRVLNEDQGLEREAEVMGGIALNRSGAAGIPYSLTLMNAGPGGSRVAGPDSVHDQPTSAPIQRYRLDRKKVPGAYVPRKDESRQAFTERMRKEMDTLRSTMKDKDALADSGKTDRDDYHGPVEKNDVPNEPRKRADPSKKTAVLERIRHAQQKAPSPTVAISYRGAFGYDKGAFEKGTTKASAASVPPGFQAPGRDDPPIRQPLFGARKPEMAGTHLREVKASGLYIPGGQDAVDDALEEKTREDYEQALIRNARNTGLPTLGICGGSRCLARGFGAQGVELSDDDKAVHNRRGTAAMAHPLKFPDPHTILGSAARRGTVDSINSTHQKIVSYREVDTKQVAQDAARPPKVELSPVNRLDATGETELSVSAQSPEGHPEGFETRYGAPMIGVTSHPEAIHGASSAARDAATDQGREWSDNVFKAFEQSMRTHAARQEVNRALREEVSSVQPAAESHPAVTFSPHLQAAMEESEKMRLRAGAPETEVQIGKPTSRFKRRPYRKGKL